MSTPDEEPVAEDSSFDQDCIQVAKDILKQRVDRSELSSSFGTLKVKTQLCILQNRKFFSDLATHKPDCNPFSRISNAMRKEIIELSNKMQKDRVSTEDSFELQCHILGLLMNHKVTDFYFPLELMACENEAAATELCRQLVEQRPPNLRTVVSVSPYHFSDDEFWKIRPLADNMMDAFPNLEVLQLDGCIFGDGGLRTVAEQLSNLRVLDVFLCGEHTTREGIAALSQLKRLEEFYFFKDMCEFRLINTVHMCLELLPQLHSFMLKPKPSLCKNLLRILGNYTSKALSRLDPDRPVTLQLRRVALSTAVPPHVAMPELRVLCHSRPSNDTELGLSDDSFPRLSELALYGVSRRKLMSYLGHVGHQLDALHIEVNNIIQLDRVLDNCPGLSELSVFGRGLNSSVDLPNLQRLRWLQVTFKDANYEHQPELFIELLRLAPELRVVDLSMQKVHPTFFEQLCLLVKERTSMRHLEEFKVYVDNDQCDSFERAMPEIALVLCAYECENLKNLLLKFKRPEPLESDEE